MRLIARTPVVYAFRSTVTAGFRDADLMPVVNRLRGNRGHSDRGSSTASEVRGTK